VMRSFLNNDVGEDSCKEKLFKSEKFFFLVSNTPQEYVPGSVISVWEFHILDPSKYASFVPPYSFKFHLSFNTLDGFVFSFFSAI